MKETTDWKQKSGSTEMRSGDAHERESRRSGYTDSGLLRAGLAVAAGLIIALLAKGVKDSDYYD